VILILLFRLFFERSSARTLLQGTFGREKNRKHAYQGQARNSTNERKTIGKKQSGVFVSVVIFSTSNRTAPPFGDLPKRRTPTLVVGSKMRRIAIAILSLWLASASKLLPPVTGGGCRCSPPGTMPQIPRLPFCSRQTKFIHAQLHIHIHIHNSERLLYGLLDFVPCGFSVLL